MLAFYLFMLCDDDDLFLVHLAFQNFYAISLQKICPTQFFFFRFLQLWRLLHSTMTISNWFMFLFRIKLTCKSKILMFRIRLWFKPCRRWHFGSERKKVGTREASPAPAVTRTNGGSISLEKVRTREASPS